jgi:hypothetical protein
VYIFNLRKVKFSIPEMVCYPTRAVGRTMNLPADYKMYLVEATERIGLERVRQTIEQFGKARDAGHRMSSLPRVPRRPVSALASRSVF